MSKTNQLERETKIQDLTEALINKKPLLRQYSQWLETSEYSCHKEEDIVNTIMGAMQALSDDVDFIPGPGFENFVEVLYRVQKRTGLDLGLCKHLEYHSNKTSECNAKNNLLIGSLNCCLPPLRSKCQYRN